MHNIKDIVTLLQDPSLDIEVKQHIVCSYFPDIIRSDEFSIRKLPRNFLRRDSSILVTEFLKQLYSSYDLCPQRIKDELKNYLTTSINNLGKLEDNALIEELLTLAAKVIPSGLIENLSLRIQKIEEMGLITRFWEILVDLFATENFQLKRTVFLQLHHIICDENNSYQLRQLAERTLLVIVAPLFDKLDSLIRYSHSNQNIYSKNNLKLDLCNELCYLTDRDPAEVEQKIELMVQLGELKNRIVTLREPFQSLLELFVSLTESKEGFLYIPDWSQDDFLKCVAQTTNSYSQFIDLKDKENKVAQAARDKLIIFNSKQNETTFETVFPLIQGRQPHHTGNEVAQTVAIVNLFKGGQKYSSFDILTFGLCFPLLKDILIEAIVIEKERKLTDISVAFEYIQHNFLVPLTRINNAIESLKMLDIIPDKIKPFLHDIGVGRDHLLFYVKMIEMFIRIEKGIYKPKFEIVKLDELLQEVKDKFEPKKKDLGKQINLQIKDDISIGVDRESLSLALGELLNNALTFSQHICEISYSMSSNFVEIVVRDDGELIAEKDREKIFQKYYTKGRQDGTGLGLAFVNKVAVLHKGKVEYKEHPSAPIPKCFRLIIPK